MALRFLHTLVTYLSRSIYDIPNRQYGPHLSWIISVLTSSTCNIRNVHVQDLRSF